VLSRCRWFLKRERGMTVRFFEEEEMSHILFSLAMINLFVYFLLQSVDDIAANDIDS